MNPILNFEIFLFFHNLCLSIAVQVLRRRYADKNADINFFRWLLFADISLVAGGIVLITLFNFEVFNVCFSSRWLLVPIIGMDIAFLVLIRLIMHEWHWSKKSKEKDRFREYRGNTLINFLFPINKKDD